MARHLHTAVADELRKIANGDAENLAELQMESLEYANEVRGFYDYDEPDYEMEYEGEDDNAGEDDNDGGMEDLGWDGGMEA